MTESFDPNEPVRVDLGRGGPLVRSMSLPEYWKLFWVPVVGQEAALVYELLALFLVSGRSLPRKGALLRHLGMRPDQLREAVLVLSKQRLLERDPAGAQMLLVFPPPVMVGDFPREHMSPELAEAHREYLADAGYDISRLETRPVVARQLSVLGDEAPELAHAPVAEARRARKTSPEAGAVVEHFRERVARSLGIPSFEIRGSSYAIELRIANAFLKDYSLDDTKRILDEFFASDPAAPRVSSLKEIRARHQLLFNRIAHGPILVRPAARGPRGRLVGTELDAYGSPARPAAPAPGGGEW